MEYDYSRQYNKFNEEGLIGPLLTSKRYMNSLAPFLSADKTTKILEIGPGNGLTMKLLLEQGYSSILGLEVDKGLAELAITKGLNVKHVPSTQLNDTLMSLEDEFDLVFCMHVIEHVAKDQQITFVRAINAALKKGGHFVCETPNALGPIANYFRYNDWTHTCAFTPISLQFLFENSGFQVLYSGAAIEGYPHPRGGKVLSLLKHIAEITLKHTSRTIYRIRYVSELGFTGFNIPLTQALLIFGTKE